MWSKKRGTIQKSIGIGKTLGEEALCDCYYLNRTEGAFVVDNSAAVLCIDRDEWIAARERLLQQSLIGRQALISPVMAMNKFDKIIRDINQLDEVFRHNFYSKRKVKVSGNRGLVFLPKIKYGNNYSHLLNGEYRQKRLNDNDHSLKVNFIEESGI